MSIDPVFFGVDIGRRTVRVAAGYVNPDGVTLVGTGSCPTWGLDATGVLVRPLELAEAVRSAMMEAEEEASSRAVQVHISLPATLLRTTTATGHVRIGAEHSGESGAQRAQENALANVAAGFHVVHSRLVRVAVEPSRGTGDAGELTFSATYSLLGTRGVDLAGYRRAVELCGIEVAGVTFAPLAAGGAVLSYDERERGALVVHLEANQADVVLFRYGMVQYASTVPVEHLAAELERQSDLNQLPQVLVLSGEDAEAHGLTPDEEAIVPIRKGDPARTAAPPELAAGVGLLVAQSEYGPCERVRALAG